jgi:hypothetical protein
MHHGRQLTCPGLQFSPSPRLSRLRRLVHTVPSWKSRGSRDHLAGATDADPHDPRPRQKLKKPNHLPEPQTAMEYARDQTNRLLQTFGSKCTTFTSRFTVYCLSTFKCPTSTIRRLATITSAASLVERGSECRCPRCLRPTLPSCAGITVRTRLGKASFSRPG